MVARRRARGRARTRRSRSTTRPTSGSGRRSRRRSRGSSTARSSLTATRRRRSTRSATTSPADADAPPPPGRRRSGKTAVAAWALAAAALAGRQAALLAPTDLLARQHTDARRAARGPRHAVELLTGSLTGERRGERARGARVRAGADRRRDARAAPGGGGVRRPRARGHRRAAPVRRGAARPARGEGGGGAPHVLLMTATPIPRTLGQVLYADLDVSDLRTPPAAASRSGPGSASRTSSTARGSKVRDEAAAGHRTFVVVPLIDAGRADDADGATPTGRATTSCSTRTSAPWPRRPRRSGCASCSRRCGSGSSTADSRPSTATPRWRASATASSTCSSGRRSSRSGVDVPEATMMVVEGADRFGLAQLHQLRGRVGRGDRRLVLRAGLRRDGRDRPARRSRRSPRLRDGFELAERDFELRREGDVLGLAQSGLPRLRVASLQRHDHRELAAAPGTHAEALLDEAGGCAEADRRSPTSSRTAGCARVRRRSGERGLTGSGRTRPMADAGRVIAGSARGVRLAAPGEGTRPLADRVKQTLFAILEPDLDGAVVSDLFAGSGAGGIEALSRGAARAVFVERDAGASRRHRGEPAPDRPRRPRARSWRGTRSPGWATPAAPRGRTVRRRPRRPAVRGHGRAPAGRSSSSAPHARPRTAGGRQALLARAARRDRAASIASASAASARPR